jgi:hypothetical protein
MTDTIIPEETKEVIPQNERVAGVWVRRMVDNGNGEMNPVYLLIRRSATDNYYPNRLGLLTETFDSEEKGDVTIEDAAKRGVVEEFEGRLTVGEAYPLTDEMRDKDGASYQLFIVDAVMDSEGHSNEIQSAEWLSLDGLKQRYLESEEEFLPRMDGPIALLSAFERGAI